MRKKIVGAVAGIDTLRPYDGDGTRYNVFIMEDGSLKAEVAETVRTVYVVDATPPRKKLWGIF